MANDTHIKNIFNLLKIITYLWLTIIGVVVIVTISPDSSKYEGIAGFFKNLTFENFNNWGDFFAGFFAPLAFAWVGYGIFIQREEFANLAESIKAQKEEMARHSVEFEKQTDQIDQQINLVTSQELANLYGTYSTNMAKLYEANNINLDDLNKDFSSITSGHADVVKHIETIENILLYNNQIETYFFDNETSKESDITNMLKIDYDVIHAKKINAAKMLYLKIAILAIIKNKYHALNINLPANISIKKFISEDLSEKIEELIASSSKTDEMEMATVIFDNITTDEKNAINYIKVT